MKLIKMIVLDIVGVLIVVGVFNMNMLDYIENNRDKLKYTLALDEAYREKICSEKHLIRRDINAIENDTNGEYWPFLAKFKTSHSI